MLDKLIAAKTLLCDFYNKSEVSEKEDETVKHCLELISDAICTLSENGYTVENPYWTLIEDRDKINNVDPGDSLFSEFSKSEKQREEQIKDFLDRYGLNENQVDIERIRLEANQVVGVG